MNHNHQSKSKSSNKQEDYNQSSQKDDSLEELTLRDANDGDLMFLFNLRNHPKVIETSFNEEPVELETHSK